jgi:hypothetical protein
MAPITAEERAVLELSDVAFTGGYHAFNATDVMEPGRTRIQWTRPQAYRKWRSHHGFRDIPRNRHNFTRGWCEAAIPA